MQKREPMKISRPAGRSWTTPSVDGGQAICITRLRKRSAPIRIRLYSIFHFLTSLPVVRRAHFLRYMVGILNSSTWRFSLTIAPTLCDGTSSISFMIERFGKVLNGNRTFYLTRGQPPLLAWSVENYLNNHKDDDELAMLAYPNLERSYTGYWKGPDHITPIGLSTCRDSGTGADLNSTEGPQLAAECESGLDFTPIFDGDIRRCVPLHINCALVRQAHVLSALAERFGWQDKAEKWKKEAESQADNINRYCWDENEGFYFEYDYVRNMKLPFYSLNGYWPLWAGIASKAQAGRAVDHLQQFDHPYGLTFTDKEYPNPHPEFKALEWAYPESWPPQQVIVALALKQYGFPEVARKVNRRYIENVVTTWEKTGTTWERYNAVQGGHWCPVERTEVARLHGWSSSSAVVIGRLLFT